MPLLGEGGKDAIVFPGLAGSGVMGLASRRTSDRNCATAGSQSRVGLPGAGTGAEDRPTPQFSNRRPSPFADRGDGAGAAGLDRTSTGAELGGTMWTSRRAGHSDQDRRLVASVEQMESYLQKKPCTPASKNARTCSGRE